MIDYTLGEPIPGEFEHKGLDCAVHGANVVHFRPYKSCMPHYCVKCSLEAMSRKYDEELSRDNE